MKTRHKRILRQIDDLIKLHKSTGNTYTSNELEVIKRSVVALKV